MSKDNLGNTIANTANNNINDYLDRIDEILNNMPTGNKRKLSPENSPSIEVDENESLLCDKLNEINEWTEWSVSLVSIFAEFPIQLALLLTEITGETCEYLINKSENSTDNVVEWINNKISKGLNIKNKKHKKTYKRFLIISAKVNRALKIAQRLAYKIMKNVLQKIAGGKLTNIGISFINGIINAFKGLSNVLNVAMEYVNNIIKALPIMLQLDGELMGFFITPKSLKTMTLKPTNDQNSIFSGLGNEIFYTINDYISSDKISQKENNTNKILENGTDAANSESIPDTPEFDLETLTPEKIHQKVNQLLSIFIQSEPLPEYKNLKLTNIGYQIWLNTTFEPAMKKSFGLPGFP